MMSDKTSAIKEYARDIGFSDCGIAAVEKLNDEYIRYEQWLSLGYHGHLGYMVRNSEKREDISLIVPGARSVIVLTHNYYTPHTHSAAESDTSGKLARYAWGDDYHDVLPPKLEKLSKYIKELYPDTESRCYTDTGPILEKQWAVKAGVGWQGKHSNIISRGYGSWFFIAVIITTAELIPDAPMQDFCGSCTACVDACPTDAIVQPYVVDAGKCISYWTIEAKPDICIPEPIAQNMNGWLFGCDICQDVCPWNRFQKHTEEKSFEPRNNETSIDYIKLETMVQDEFSERFRKSPIKRTKLKGIQRNIAAIKGAKSD